MTKNLYVIGMQEIDNLKVVCKKCGFAVHFPVQTGYSTVKQCVNCSISFPVNEIQAFLDAVKALRSSLSIMGSNQDIEIEIEQIVK
ncbi:MAG: hypothetical protein JRE47_12625 [Deltaproteobacteria bacterium]|nr:hypothetical protein [Deltaproteobacteria bacterium]